MKHAPMFAIWMLAILMPPEPGRADSHRLAALLRQQEVGQTISVESEAVNVDVLVTDEDGGILNGLRKEEFRILDNGRLQAITNFVPAAAPIAIVMLMEYSGHAYDYFAYRTVYWGSKFLSHVEGEDWVALVTCDMKPTVPVDFTRNKAQVRDVLAGLGYPVFHEVNMFDPSAETLERLEEIKGSILLITTGANSFSFNTLDDIYAKLRQTDHTIFPLGVAEREYGPGVRTDIASFQAKNQLETFARLTGGCCWFPRYEAEVPDIFQSVVTFLRNQYALAFLTSAAAGDSKFHKLRIEVVNANGKPLVSCDKKGSAGRLSYSLARVTGIDSAPRTDGVISGVAKSGNGKEVA